MAWEGFAGVAGEDGEAEAAGDGFGHEADLVGEAAGRDAADAGVAGVPAGEEAGEHGAAVGVVDEAEALQIVPAAHLLAGGNDQLQRFFGEVAGGEAGVVGFEGDDAEFEAVVEHGVEHFTVGGEAVADGQAGHGLLQVEQGGVERQADAAGGDDADLAGVCFRRGQTRVEAAGGLFEFGAVFEQRTAGGGEFELARAADEQRAELLFEVAYVLADGGLREVQAFGGAGEAAGLDEGCEALELLRVEHNDLLFKR